MTSCKQLWPFGPIAQPWIKEYLICQYTFYEIKMCNTKYITARCNDQVLEQWLASVQI